MRSETAGDKGRETERHDAEESEKQNKTRRQDRGWAWEAKVCSCVFFDASNSTCQSPDGTPRGDTGCPPQTLEIPYKRAPG